MKSEADFNGKFEFSLRWLRLVSLLSAGFCFAMIFFGGLDPWHALDGLIWEDLYGSAELPGPAQPAYLLIFRLFCWLSVLSFSLLFLIVKHALMKRERWAYLAVLLTGAGWPFGRACLALSCKAYSYLFSSLLTGLLFFPPLIQLYPYFRKGGC